MSQSDKDTQFRNIADKVIDSGNSFIENNDPILVSTGLLYGVARFTAFTVAAQAEDKQQFLDDKPSAVEYFVGEYRRMLEENLVDYEGSFSEPLKYEHLMNKD